jgi:hypothetical protein
MARSTPEEKLASAKKAIRAILELDILERHRDELLSLMIWKITEAGGKYNLRFCTVGTLRNPVAKRQHEHVYPRKWLIAQLKADPSLVDEVLAKAFGCVITIDEHRRLSAASRGLLGWDRYRAAGIRVYDKQADAWIFDAGESSSDGV